DKAVYPIEASYAGVFKSWKIKIDDTVLIGQSIALVTGDAASVAGMPVEGAVSPELAPEKSVPFSSAKAMEDKKTPPTAPKSTSTEPVVTGVASTAPTSTPSGSMPGTIRPPALSSSITKRLDAVVPANLLMDCRWEPLRLAREKAKAKQGKAA